MPALDRAVVGADGASDAPPRVEVASDERRDHDSGADDLSLDAVGNEAEPSASSIRSISPDDGTGGRTWRKAARGRRLYRSKDAARDDPARGAQPFGHGRRGLTPTRWLASSAIAASRIAVRSLVLSNGAAAAASCASAACSCRSAAPSWPWSA